MYIRMIKSNINLNLFLKNQMVAEPRHFIEHQDQLKAV